MIWFVLGLIVGALVTGVLARIRVTRVSRRMLASERRARSAERLAEIGSMTSGLAHEIKNPLSTIGLNAQLLSEAIGDLPVDEQERGRLTRRVGTLRQETERLRGILEDFLQYAGELRLHTRETGVNALVEQLTDFFHVQAESAGVRLRADLASPDVSAVLDADHVKQALLNFMLNACAAMEEAQSPHRDLILRVRPVRGADGEELVALHVIDTGPGIDDATRDRVFHPYFTTKASGTGLGLSTSRRIAEAHGGHVELHTEPGKGSDFALVLPVTGPASEIASDQPSA